MRAISAIFAARPNERILGVMDGTEARKLTIKEACREFSEPKPRRTLNDWLHRGVLNRKTGIRVFLAYELLGGQIRISRESVHAFINDLKRIGREP